MKPYLIQFAHSHPDFRIAEIEALAKLELGSIPHCGWRWEPHYNPLLSPFAIIHLPNDDCAAKLVRRSILVKHIWALWAHADTYADLFALLKPRIHDPAYMQTSFKFTVDSFNVSHAQKDKVKIINSFSFLDYQGKIDLRTPEVTFGVLEAWTPPPGTPQLTHVYFGTLVGDGDRKSIDAFNLKRRKYLGTTSMDPELSLIMGNMALVKSGALVYDPFVGTGSFLCTSTHFGGLTMGSDIDGRQLRGTGKGSARQSDKPGTVSVFSNIEQYGVQAKVVGCMVFDLAHHGWRTDRPLLDAIITDPPYGVRAGAKKIGGTKWRPETVKDEPLRQYTPKHEMGRFPATVPYDLDAVMIDLTEFAAKMLVVGGRISYWLPTVKEEYHPSDVPLHPALELVSNCEQPFGQWSRRLITLEKIADWQPGMRATGSGLLGAKLDSMGAAGAHAMEEALASSAGDAEGASEASRVGKKKGGGEVVQVSKEPGHKGFREKYFAFASSRRDDGHSTGSDLPEMCGSRQPNSA